MNTYKIICIIGGLLLIVPFLGVPDLWKQCAVAAIGIFLLCYGYKLWKQKRSSEFMNNISGNK